MTKTIKLGDRISWTSYGKPARGTVVKINRFPWCFGASTVTVLTDADAPLPTCETELPLGIGYTIVDGHESVTDARARLTAHLSQYPAWRENIARGIVPGSGWGSYSGFSRVASS